MWLKSILKAKSIDNITMHFINYLNFKFTLKSGVRLQKKPPKFHSYFPQYSIENKCLNLF
jgi:hypothetical protein